MLTNEFGLGGTITLPDGPSCVCLFVGQQENLIQEYGGRTRLLGNGGRSMYRVEPKGLCAVSAPIHILEYESKNAIVVGGSPLEQQAMRMLFSDIGYAVRSINHINLVTAPIEPETLVLARLKREDMENDTIDSLLQTCRNNPIIFMVPKSMEGHKLPPLPNNVRSIVYTGIPTERLASILNLVADGMSVLPQTPLERIAAPSIDFETETNEVERLTNRERDIAAAVADGFTSKEIGRSLDISMNTVNAHLHSVMRKLDLTKRTQVAVWWIRQSANLTVSMEQ